MTRRSRPCSVDSTRSQGNASAAQGLARGAAYRSVAGFDLTFTGAEIGRRRVGTDGSPHPGRGGDVPPGFIQAGRAEADSDSSCDRNVSHGAGGLPASGVVKP